MSLVWNFEVIASARYIHLVAIHRSVVGVVAMVRDSPGEVRRPEEGVCNLESKLSRSSRRI